MRPLTPDEREALWQDYRRWGELFRLPRSETPETYAEFRSWFDGRLASDEVHLTEEAREIGRIVALEIPGAPVDRPALQAFNLIVIGSLPARVRKMYGLRWTPAHAAAYAAAGGPPGRPPARPGQRPARARARRSSTGSRERRSARAAPGRARRGRRRALRRGLGDARWRPSGRAPPAPAVGRLVRGA